MGRSKRGQKIPEALRQLGEEGLPDGYGQYWYGSGGERSFPFASSLTEDDLQAIASGISRHDLLKILNRSTLYPDNFSLEDPFGKALWEGELKMLQESFAQREILLRFLKDHQEKLQQMWSDSIVHALKVVEDTQAAAKAAPFSLWGSVCISKLPELLDDPERAQIEEEVVEGLIYLSRRSRDRFRLLSQRALVPGISDQYFSDVLFQHAKEERVVHLARETITAVFGAEYERVVSRDRQTLEEMDYFRSGFSERDFYLQMLSALALDYRKSDPNDWCPPSEEGQKRILTNILRLEVGGVGSLPSAQKRFLSSPLALSLKTKYSLEDEEIMQIAESLEEVDYHKILKGEETLEEVFRRLASMRAAAGDWVS